MGGRLDARRTQCSRSSYALLVRWRLGLSVAAWRTLGGLGKEAGVWWRSHRSGSRMKGWGGQRADAFEGDTRSFACARALVGRLRGVACRTSGRRRARRVILCICVTSIYLSGLICLHMMWYRDPLVD